MRIKRTLGRVVLENARIRFAGTLARWHQSLAGGIRDPGHAGSGQPGEIANQGTEVIAGFVRIRVSGMGISSSCGT
ncbi:hypothetical protein [Rhodanobacter sp. C05]|uniref:hypothetical protein n=1 Tax=Rhodanobacter sp. C05 TaxID=1945855 RepID=UPI00117AC1EC|nr:hypothetical protein [Rhodanobacter sp. C05]